MINKEQIAAFRELLERFGTCPFRNEELPFVHDMLFAPPEKEAIFLGGPSWKTVCETLKYLREMMLEERLSTLELVIAYHDQLGKEMTEFLDKLSKMTPEELKQEGKERRERLKRRFDQNENDAND